MIDKVVAQSPPTQLVVVLCSTRHDENCKAAEKMMARLNHKFVRDAQAEAARQPKPPPKKVASEVVEDGGAGEVSPVGTPSKRARIADISNGSPDSIANGGRLSIGTVLV